MASVVEEIYIAQKGSVEMKCVEEVLAVAGGLEGDRYKEGTGYWTPYGETSARSLL